MMKFDHLNLPVSNLERSRDWWVSTLGLKIEFEVTDTRTVALNDGEGFAIFLQEKPGAASPASRCGSRSTTSTPSTPPGAPRGVGFNHGPQKKEFGHGAADPDLTPTVCGIRSR